MSHLDGERVYFSDQNFRQTDDPFPVEQSRNDAYKKALRFLREFNSEDKFKYRDQIKANVANNEYLLRVEINDINNFDHLLYNFIMEHPQDAQPCFEKAIKEIHCQDALLNQTECQDFQLQLISSQQPSILKDLNPSLIGKLVTLKCIVIASKSIRVKAKVAVASCRECNDKQYFDLGFGPQPLQLPRICLGKAQNKGLQTDQQCPTDPYGVIPEECTFIDQQTLRVQELPESVPTGEIPRNFTVFCDRYLVNSLIAGQRCIITGIYLVPPQQRNSMKSNAMDRELQLPYVHIMGVQTSQTREHLNIPEHEILYFKSIVRSGNIYKILKQSIAPAIFGHEEIKLALACLLFSGSGKQLPDGMKLRGDINVLLIGDPSTAKSQMLKFVERACDISVYTSGKGSSAAGLTASITFQQNTSQFTLEAGALVLASGGVCCIDEFDKMRPEDRVAMHEAMEQQTISVAKAGITTRLNAKCSILAAANPIFGRYQESKSIQDQIELQTTILSRFDMIFIVKDIRSEERDKMIAGHILKLHTEQRDQDMQVESDGTTMDLDRLKRFVRYAKQSVSPRLSEQAAQMIQNLYIEDREKSRQQGQHQSHGGKSHIPITVRQLEAIIRISESLAKMELKQDVNQAHVKEAHRLFQNSTMNAVSLGAKEFGLDLSAEMKALVEQIEESIMRRVHIGSKIPQQKLTEELVQRFNNMRAVEFAILRLVKLEVLQQMENKKVLIRKK